MRLASSAGALGAQSAFGTTPNIAPPSNPKKPSQTVMSSRSPTEYRATASRRAGRAGGGDCFNSTSTPCAAAGWMNATSAPSAPWTGVLTDQTGAPRLQMRERRPDVVDVERDVVQPGTAFFKKPRDRRVSRRRLQQLELRFANRNERRAHPLRGHLLGRLDL